MGAPVSHCAAGKPKACCRSCYILSMALLRESSCSCESCFGTAAYALLFKQVHTQGATQEILTGCDASSAAAAPFTALLLTAGAIALVVHEEPNFASKTDPSRTPVKAQDQSGNHYCTAWQSRKKKMLLWIVYM